MKTAFPVAWRIRECMTAAGIDTAKELHEKLTALAPGFLAYAQVARIVQACPRRLPLELLGWLCTVLSCRPGDLLDPSPIKHKKIKNTDRDQV